MTEHSSNRNKPADGGLADYKRWYRYAEENNLLGTCYMQYAFMITEEMVKAVEEFGKNAQQKEPEGPLRGRISRSRVKTEKK